MLLSLIVTHDLNRSIGKDNIYLGLQLMKSVN